jgi:hypothetical protein
MLLKMLKWIKSFEKTFEDGAKKHYQTLVDMGAVLTFRRMDLRLGDEIPFAHYMFYLDSKLFTLDEYLTLIRSIADIEHHVGGKVKVLSNTFSYTLPYKFEWHRGRFRRIQGKGEFYVVFGEMDPTHYPLMYDPKTSKLIGPCIDAIDPSHSKEDILLHIKKGYKLKCHVEDVMPLFWFGYVQTFNHVTQWDAFYVYMGDQVVELPDGFEYGLDGFVFGVHLSENVPILVLAQKMTMAFIGEMSNVSKSFYYPPYINYHKNGGNKVICFVHIDSKGKSVPPNMPSSKIVAIKGHRRVGEGGVGITIYDVKAERVVKKYGHSKAYRTTSTNVGNMKY